MKSFAEFEFAGWERVAVKYDATWATLTRLFIPALLEAAGVRPGVRVLDVASGPGYVAEGAARLGAEVTGLDFAPQMVRLARSRHPTLQFRAGDAQALPFTDRSFDAVVMSFGLLHLPEPERGLSEAARVLRAGGRYAFTVWAGPAESAGARVFETAIQAHANLDVPLPAGPARFGFGAVDEARATLARNGFDAGSVAVRSVGVTWRIPSEAFLFDAQRHAGVRNSGLLAAQTPQALESIRLALAAGLREFRVPEGFAIPYVAHVIAAAVPDR